MPSTRLPSTRQHAQKRVPFFFLRVRSQPYVTLIPGRDANSTIQNSYYAPTTKVRFIPHPEADDDAPVDVSTESLAPIDDIYDRCQRPLRLILFYAFFSAAMY